MDERTDTDMGKELLAMLLEAARGAPATTLLLAASALAVLAQQECRKRMEFGSVVRIANAGMQLAYGLRPDPEELQ